MCSQEVRNSPSNLDSGNQDLHITKGLPFVGEVFHYKKNASRWQSLEGGKERWVRRIDTALRDIRLAPLVRNPIYNNRARRTKCQNFRTQALKSLQRIALWPQEVQKCRVGLYLEAQEWAALRWKGQENLWISSRFWLGSREVNLMVFAIMSAPRSPSHYLRLFNLGNNFSGLGLSANLK